MRENFTYTHIHTTNDHENMFKDWFAARSYWRQSCAIKHLHKREQAMLPLSKLKKKPFSPFINSKHFFLKGLNAAYSCRNVRNNSSWTCFQSTKIWVRVYIVNRMSSNWMETWHVALQNDCTQQHHKINMHFLCTLYSILKQDIPNFLALVAKNKIKNKNTSALHVPQIPHRCTTDVIKFRAP